MAISATMKVAPVTYEARLARWREGGRVVFDNIKRSLMFILPSHGGQASVLLLEVFAGLPLPVMVGTRLIDHRPARRHE